MTFQFRTKFYTALADCRLLGCETLQFDRQIRTFRKSLQSSSRRQRKHVPPKLLYRSTTQVTQRYIVLEGYNLYITSARTSNLKFHAELKILDMSYIFIAFLTPFNRRQAKRCLPFHEYSQILKNVVRVERCSV